MQHAGLGITAPRCMNSCPPLVSSVMIDVQTIMLLLVVLGVLRQVQLFAAGTWRYSVAGRQKRAIKPGMRPICSPLNSGIAATSPRREETAQIEQGTQGGQKRRTNHGRFSFASQLLKLRSRSSLHVIARGQYVGVVAVRPEEPNQPAVQSTEQLMKLHKHYVGLCL